MAVRHDVVTEVAGDKTRLRVTVPGIPVGITLASVQLLIGRRRLTLAAAPLITKVVNSGSPVPDVGQIEESNSGGGGTVVIRFDFSAAEAALLVPRGKYVYLVRLTYSDGSAPSSHFGNWWPQ